MAFYPMDLKLEHIVEKFADGLVAIDASGIPFRNFSLGVGPYGEPQLLSQVAAYLNATLPCNGRICTESTPDLLIPDQWAIECKIARPLATMESRLMGLISYIRILGIQAFWAIASSCDRLLEP